MIAAEAEKLSDNGAAEDSWTENRRETDTILTWQIGDFLVKHKASNIIRSQPKLSVWLSNPRCHARL